MKTPVKSKTTPQRLAEYAAELKAKGIDDFRATVEGRTFTFDFSHPTLTIAEAQNPADLVEP
ncbi:hypothetical protein [Pseudophaeobacter flagellatus]|uniref:hypothetical protein n=1 Tax=Pseudophaeobacter flagellatus TaxID=2899119 RepID=UPI001E422A6E|nr:hypothetical protein [Pseudophaeobacter flagellatus]MCD9147466.1 hypothetical protein [Pseudophaeobacter flagellatus]